MSVINTDAARDAVSDALLRGMDPAGHNIGAFDDLVRVHLKNIIEKQSGRIVTAFKEDLYILSLHNYRFVRGLTPSQCHLYNESLVGKIYVDVHISIYTKEDTGVPSEIQGHPFVRKRSVHKDLHLCNFPVMLFSSACHLSEGHDVSSRGEIEFSGGFIMRGKRRFLPSTQTMANNMLFCLFSKNENSFYVQIRSEHPDRPHRSTSTLEMYMSASASTRTVIFHNAEVRLPFLKKRVPLTVMVLALGWTIEEFVSAVRTSAGPLFNHRLFRKYFITFRCDGRDCTSRVEALGYIAKLYGKPQSDTRHAEHSIRSTLLPHMNGLEPNSRYKGFFLAIMYARLVLAREGRIELTDRDSMCNIRLRDAATELAMLFRQKFKSFVLQGVKIMRRSLSQEGTFDVTKVFGEERLSSKLSNCVSTGIFTQDKKAVTHQMITTNAQAVISQHRRITSSYANSAGSHMKPRMVHETSFGYKCPSETPERECCGLVSSLAITARVTRRTHCESVMQEVFTRAAEVMVRFDGRSFEENAELFKVFDALGRFRGWCDDVDDLIKAFLDARRNLAIDTFATFKCDRKLREWHLLCDSGRKVRPLLRADRAEDALQIVSALPIGAQPLPDLLASGCVEYVCASEERDLRVTFPTRNTDPAKFTHFEINDFSFAGIAAALTPFFKHDQGPRLAYWISMMKQKIGTRAKRDFGSIATHNLWYGQRPLCVTKAARRLGMHKSKDCVMVHVLFDAMPENQEDAIVMNRAFADRAGFTSSSVRTYSSEATGNFVDASSDKFERPDPNRTFSMSDKDYSKIGANGLPEVGARLNGNDVVIGKTVPTKRISMSANVSVPKRIRAADYKRRRDKSKHVNKDEAGVVESVSLVRKPYRQIAKVRVRTTRVPIVGDKFTNRHAQKGTISVLEAPENLPFSAATGLIPDLVVSALGQYSRKTIGNLLEMFVSKAALLSGKYEDAFDDQVFRGSSEQLLDHIAEVFQEHGLPSSGKELYIDGRTGQPKMVLSSSGYVAYSRLAHLVERKARARASGPVNQLTRQPPEGRIQNGGLRLGEMEIKCLNGHGVAKTITERMQKMCDLTTIFMCKQCGFQADGNENIGKYFCRYCKTGTHVRRVEFGYSSKLYLQETNATGVKIKMELEDFEE